VVESDDQLGAADVVPPPARGEDRDPRRAATLLTMETRRFRSRHWLTDPRCRIVDRLGLLLGQRDLLTPPAGLFDDPDRVDGSRDVRDFVTIGENTVAWLITEGLEPTDAVLEVGCGIGRMAIPLMRHLRDPGSYVGLEIDPGKVRYCRATVGAAAANFEFHHIDVFSKYYNPRGSQQARDYVFPFQSGRFDFVFLASVFTHMLPEGMERYVREIARVMAQDGTLICSYWLSRAPVGPPCQPFSDVSDVYNPDEPEHGVVFRESYVKEVMQDAGLRIQRLWHGSKFGHDDPDHNPGSQQDLLIVRKA
jgi:SAM-dependent methyltransferase